jgi:hypothetical protein
MIHLLQGFVFLFSREANLKRMRKRTKIRKEEQHTLVKKIYVLLSPSKETNARLSETATPVAGRLPPTLPGPSEEGKTTSIFFTGFNGLHTTVQTSKPTPQLTVTFK